MGGGVMVVLWIGLGAVLGVGLGLVGLFGWAAWVRRRDGR
jgi:hypothetical protein